MPDLLVLGNHSSIIRFLKSRKLMGKCTYYALIATRILQRAHSRSVCHVSPASMKLVNLVLLFEIKLAHTNVIYVRVRLLSRLLRGEHISWDAQRFLAARTPYFFPIT